MRYADYLLAIGCLLTPGNDFLYVENSLRTKQRLDEKIILQEAFYLRIYGQL
jgi:hypothetical protein